MDTLELPATAVGRTDSAPPGRTSPRHRAPLVLRVFIGLVAAGSAATTVALLLSDRAPGVLRRAFGDTARSLWARIDADRRAAIEATGATAEPDLVVHVLIWTVVTLLVALTGWTWRWLMIAGALSAIASIALEFGQRRWADTRAFEVGDLLANLVGVTLGIVVAALVMATWSAVGAAWERSTDRAEHSDGR